MTGTPKSGRVISGPLPPKNRRGFSLKTADEIRARPQRRRGPQNAKSESKNVGFYSKTRLGAIFGQGRRTSKNLCKRLQNMVLEARRVFTHAGSAKKSEKCNPTHFYFKKVC